MKISVLDKLDMRPLTQDEAQRRRRAIREGAAAIEDKDRLDWMSQGEDTGSSNIDLGWQCMLSHQPGDLRQVIDMLRKKSKQAKKGKTR